MQTIGGDYGSVVGSVNDPLAIDCKRQV